MLTREEALAKHREMWSAMQKELGNNPNVGKRCDFKSNWVWDHDGQEIVNDCYLCEFAANSSGIPYCSRCPIDWKGAPNTCQRGEVDWRFSPIHKILALPEREVNGGDSD